MRRDDRPRESKPKKKPAEGAAAPEVCAECALVFTEEALKRGARFRKRKDETVVCRDDRMCRVRQLTATLGQELGTPVSEEWLFFRYPRDLVRRQMDPRPKNPEGHKSKTPYWKEVGWLPRRPLHDRCMACILFSSWCYPVSLPFAVQLAGLLPNAARKQLDDDHILLDLYYQPRPLREKDIALILNEHQSNVSRALKRLVDTKELRVDEDRTFYPAAKLAEMSIAERQALYRPDHVGGDPDDELRGVPKRFRKPLALIEAHLDPDISTDIFSVVIDGCTAFNDSLRNIRTVRDTVIEQACLRGLSLLPEGLDPARAKPSVSPRASINASAVVNGGSVPPSVPSLHTAVRAQSVSQSPAPPELDRLTDTPGVTYTSIKELLLQLLGKKLPGEIPSPALCKRIATKLQDAPVEQLIERIKSRRKAITSMGMVEHLAEEVAERWNADRTARKASHAREAASLLTQDRQAAARILESPNPADDADMLIWAQQIIGAVLTDPDADTEMKERAKELLGRGALGKLPRHDQKKKGADGQ